MEICMGSTFRTLSSFSSYVIYFKNYF